MKRIKLTDLSAVRNLTPEEQNRVEGGVSWAAIGGMTVAGILIYKYGARVVDWAYDKLGRIKTIRDLLKMAPKIRARRRTSNCVTWADGERNCYA